MLMGTLTAYAHLLLFYWVCVVRSVGYYDATHSSPARWKAR